MSEAEINTIEGIVDWIIAESGTTVEQGDRFERLMYHFFRLAPVWHNQFDQVWLWNDWPGNNGETDHGIDLVAKNREDAGYTAIQAKCYARTTTLNKPEVDSFISASGGDEFTRRILVATTYDIGDKALREMERQTKPVQLLTLDGLRDAGINWADWSPETFTIHRADPKTPRDHQRAALADVLAGFKDHDRGKAIMACGTGKTYTAQIVAEHMAGDGGLVLVMAPSISLVSQTITAWSADATVPMSVFGVCSDTTAGDRDSGDISPYDLVVPATTDPAELAAHVDAAPGRNMKVIFSTYHSSAVIGDAQRIGKFGDFDLIVCDEAHRTTGVQLANEDVKAFQLVHDDESIVGKKRLYMTATPRVYKPSQRAKAAENEALLASMDDFATYGPEFHKLSFREAVDDDLLTDYKVLILTVEEEAVNEAFQRHTADLGEVNLPEAAQMVGCLNALAKRERIQDDDQVRAFAEGDTVPLQRAVAFSNTIKASKHFAAEFKRIAAEYQHITHVGEPLSIETDHVDGTQKTIQRSRKLDWLRDQPGESISRILSNAKCLTEGIDVPSLDAVLFLEPRKSQVDIIQAVGRVMRTSPGKHFGYIVIPIAVPPGTAPEAVLKEGRFKTVWQVLSALRSHDPDMNRDINQIRFGKKPRNVDIIDATPEIEVDDAAPPEPEDESSLDASLADQLQLEFDVEAFQELCWATMVQKVGDTAYLKRWAKGVADIAAALETRIAALVDRRGVKGPFGRFVKGLRANLNSSINDDDAIAMLAQHLITRPVFDSIFPNYSLLASNPIAQAMQETLEVLEDRDVETETRDLEAFYDSVRYHVDGLDDPHGRQQILIELYEEFFKTAFPKRSESLGIVYTPIEVTDFIIHAANDALGTHFDGASLSDEGVHILDPFTGTGTFIVQMLRSGLIKPHDLARKFVDELHANEIQLLAYYIATVNIETAYHTLTASNGPVQAFPGIVYTDTFQLGENEDRLELGVFPTNSKRASTQQALDIRVIVGNPPYSSGQTAANDNNANLAYPNLDRRIDATYRRGSSKQRARQALNDSYVRALRWASDRVQLDGGCGVVAFVTNGGYLEGNSFDGLRKAIAREFDFVYLYNLRGNTRNSGEAVKREGGKIFGSGSRATVAIAVLVRASEGESPGDAEIRYRDIGDYLDRNQKLNILSSQTTLGQPLAEVPWVAVSPNDRGDWVSQRSESFEQHRALIDKSGTGVFRVKSNGLQTNRDAWNYNWSLTELESNARRMIDFYNGEVDRFAESHSALAGTAKEKSRVAADFVDLDPTRFSWQSADYGRVANRTYYETQPDALRTAIYRPFTKRHVNFAKAHNRTTSGLEHIYPDPSAVNLTIVTTEPSSRVPFSVLMTDRLPDSKLYVDAVQCYPLRTTEDLHTSQVSSLFSEGAGDGWSSNVTNHVLDDLRQLDDKIAPDDIFFYVYAVLHSPDYRRAFGADLNIVVPRIPKPTSSDSFWQFSKSGRSLSRIHVEYELVDPWPDLTISSSRPPGASNASSLRLKKMRYPRISDPSSGKKVEEKSTVIYNDHVTVTDIPLRAHDWRLGSRSAIDWLIDQWQVKVDPDSGIVNDPNEWARGIGKPDYVLGLLQRIVTVSMQTLDIIDGLPALDLSS